MSRYTYTREGQSGQPRRGRRPPPQVQGVPEGPSIPLGGGRALDADGKAALAEFMSANGEACNVTPEDVIRFLDLVYFLHYNGADVRGIVRAGALAGRTGLRSVARNRVASLAFASRTRGPRSDVPLPSLLWAVARGECAALPQLNDVLEEVAQGRFGMPEGGFRQPPEDLAAIPLEENEALSLFLSSHPRCRVQEASIRQFLYLVEANDLNSEDVLALLRTLALEDRVIPLATRYASRSSDDQSRGLKYAFVWGILERYCLRMDSIVNFINGVLSGRRSLAEARGVASKYSAIAAARSGRPSILPPATVSVPASIVGPSAAGVPLFESAIGPSAAYEGEPASVDFGAIPLVLPSLPEPPALDEDEAALADALTVYPDWTNVAQWQALHRAVGSGFPFCTWLTSVRRNYTAGIVQRFVLGYLISERPFTSADAGALYNRTLSDVASGELFPSPVSRLSALLAGEPRPSSVARGRAIAFQSRLLRAIDALIDPWTEALELEANDPVGCAAVQDMINAYQRRLLPAVVAHLEGGDSASLDGAVATNANLYGLSARRT